MRQSTATDNSDYGSDGRSRVATNIVSEADRYSKSVAGINIEAMRAGQGVGPNRVTSAFGPSLIGSWVDIGFPVVTRTTIGDERVLLARFESVGPGTLWCNVEPKPGALFVYSPGAEHTAVNTPGTSFTFMVASTEQLELAHEALDIDLTIPPRGEVRVAVPSPDVAQQVRVAFDDFKTSGKQHGFLPAAASSGVLAAFAAVLRVDDFEHRIGHRKRIDNRAVVRRCVGRAEVMDRIPSTIEMCSAAHVSERRLREAFTSEFDLPPTQFFRIWALDRAHQRLRQQNPTAETVTTIAARLGFLHLGRFAGYYKSVYGETPSTTLRAGTG
jgi:AraC-like DNA-binding protein